LAAVITKKEELDSDVAFYTQYHHADLPKSGDYLGQSVITKEGRLTRWSEKPHEWNSDDVEEVAEEFYDHEKDTRETVNVVENPDYESVLEKMRAHL
jgi:hypothetical protein